MRPIVHAVWAVACAVIFPMAAGAAVELEAADRAKYQEATNLIQIWPGHGDQLERAFGLLVEIANRNPRSAYPLAALAELKYRLYGNGSASPGEVVQLADRAVKLDPQNADAQVVYAKIMLDQGQVDVAARAAERAIALAPEKPEAMFQMASMARYAKRYDEAEGWYRKAIARYGHKQRKSNVYFHLGEMLAEREPADVDKATAAYEQAADLTEDSIPILNDVAVFLMHHTERYDRAIGFIRKALRISDYPLGRQNLGLLHFLKWGHATLHPEKYANAAEKPWTPEKITAETGVSKEFAFARNPVVTGTPYATLAMLKLDTVKDINAFPENCECPDNALIASARGKHPELVRLLVAKGADVNMVDQKYGATALHYAVRFQDLEMARFLVDRGARINVQDKHGILIVEYAIMDAAPDDARVLRFLLGKGGDARAVSRAGVPLVGVAVEQGKPAALELLLKEYGADPNAELAGGALLALAAANTHDDGTKMMKLLLDAGANPWVKYGPADVLSSLRASTEAFASTADLPPQIKAAQERMLRVTQAHIAMLEQARRRVPKPARF